MRIGCLGLRAGYSNWLEPVANSKSDTEFLYHVRGIAILAVFLVHALGVACGRDELPWGPWFREFSVSKSFLLLLPFSFGWSGVAIFFVVSGFCIHLSFKRKPDWSAFFVRRFFRIYPPYVLAVLLFALVVPWTRIGFSFSGVVQFLSHLALIHNLDNSTFFGLSPAFWSIAVEVQLYLLYPILVALVSRFGWNRSLMYIAALEITLRGICSVISITTGTAPLWLDGVPFMYWFSWSAGAAVADAYVSGRSVPFANQSLLIWGGIALASTFVKPLASFSFLFFALLTVTAIAKLLRQKRATVSFSAFFSKYLRTIGVWSYSIYLLHQPFLSVASRLPGRFHVHPYPLLVFLICLFLWFPITACSGLWFRIFELPSIALGKRLTRTNSDRAPKASAAVENWRIS
jgi:peptidoglycan/LPS O-acetylase OafA/YrhL